MSRRILIADDHDLVRRTLKTALEGHEDWQVCAEAKDGLEAVQLALEFLPDAIVLDFTMPFLDGVAAAKKILSVCPRVPIVLYSQHASSTLVIEATHAGVRQVVSKSVPIDHLLDAVAAALNGRPANASDITAESPEPTKAAQAAAANRTVVTGAGGPPRVATPTVVNDVGGAGTLAAAASAVPAPGANDPPAVPDTVAINGAGDAGTVVPDSKPGGPTRQ
jgi:DNA-binding NarL/FixJ family response regulator